jgi:creatinine amidohydrolase
MPEPMFLAEMTWPDVAQCIADHVPIALIVGATEQHGPHLPLGTDGLCAFELLRRVAARTPLVLAPPLTYGYKSRPLSGGGQGFVGTTSLAATTLIALVRDVVAEFLRHGWRHILVVQEHLENQNLVYEGIDLAVRGQGAGESKIALVEDWLAGLSMQDMDRIFPHGFPGSAIEHASVLETSIMLALRPDLVRKDLIADDAAARRPLGYDIIPPPPDIIPRSGVLSAASQASRAKGDLLVREGERYFMTLLREEFGAGGA